MMLQYRFHSKKRLDYFWLLMLAFLWGGVGPVWSAIPEATTGVDVLEQSLQEELSVLHAGPFYWYPASQPKLTLAQAVKRVGAHHPEVLLARLKVDETLAKHAVVESKRVLFFFKYFDARTMEGAAEFDVDAAKAHVQVVEQRALHQTLSQVFQLGQLTLTEWVAGESALKAERALQGVRAQFHQGRLLVFDKNKSQAAVLEALQYWQQQVRQRQSLATGLTLPLGYPSEEGLVLDALDPQTPNWLSIWCLTMPASLQTLSVREWQTLAQSQRPDVQELSHRLESIRQLKKSSLVLDRKQVAVFETAETTLKQSFEQLKQQAATEVLVAYQQWQSAQHGLVLATYQRDLAQRSQAQMQLSHSRGFQSENDLKDAVWFANQSQAAWGNAFLELQRATLTLLYKAGQLTPQVLAVAVAN